MTTRSSIRRAVVLAASALLASAVVPAGDARASTGPVAFHGTVAYTGGDGVALRYAPTATGKIQPLIVWGEGHDVPIICQAWSSDNSTAGPNANHIFNKISYSGYSGDTWVPDAYVRGTAAANTYSSGIPRCTASTPPPSDVQRESWVGSPVNGIYDQGEPADGPATHHFLSGTSEHEFAFDTGAPAGTPVKVFVAPQSSGYTVTTRVIARGVVCGSAARGGEFVTIGIYANGVRTGSMTLAHISPSVAVGATVSRWGGQVGTVRGGLPKDANCWTGPHVHQELFTVGSYTSCFNGGYAHNQRINESNFIGFVGGSRARSIRQRCP